MQLSFPSEELSVPDQPFLVPLAVFQNSPPQLPQKAVDFSRPPSASLPAEGGGSEGVECKQGCLKERRKGHRVLAGVGSPCLQLIDTY